MFRRISRTLALLLAAMAAVFLSVTPASAGEEPYPVSDCTVSSTPQNPPDDSDVTISGEGWPAGATVHVTVGGEAAGTTTASDSGTWSIVYHVPAGASGDYVATADGCDPEAEVAGTTITVVGAVEAAPLPATGSSSTEPLVRTGAVLIAAGAVLVYAVRRRNQAAAS